MVLPCCAKLGRGGSSRVVESRLANKAVASRASAQFRIPALLDPVAREASFRYGPACGPHGGRDPTLGYTRISGGLKSLGREVARNTIKAILKDHGMAPAPERGTKTPWKTFLAAHWDAWRRPTRSLSRY